MPGARRCRRGAGAAELLPALLRADGTRLIRLAGLSRPDIAQWLRRTGADGDVDRLADRLRARTGGNPLFVRMLTERGAAAADDGLRGFPELRHLVLAREAARSAAEALAYDEAARFTALALHAAQDSAQPAGPRAELTIEAARAAFVTGHIETSLGHCQAAARLAGEAGRPDILAAAALVITGMGDPATAVAVDALCAKAMDAAPAQDTALGARLRARQAIFAAETGAGNRAR